MKFSEVLARHGFVNAVNDPSETPSNLLVWECAAAFLECYYPYVIRDSLTGKFELKLGRIMVTDFRTMREKSWLAVRHRIEYHLHKLSDRNAYLYRLDRLRLNDPDYWPTVVLRISDRVRSEMKQHPGCLYDLAISDESATTWLAPAEPAQ